MAYATVADLEAGWRTLTEAEEDRATVLLDRASVYLDGVVERYKIDTEAKADALKAVCCDMVQRKMETGTAVPVSAVTQTAGSFSETVSYMAGRRKSWELYPEDLELLGVRRSGIGTIKVAIHDGNGDRLDW